MFDAVAFILSQQGTAMLLKEGGAVQFVMDAFGHLKAIGRTEAAGALLEKAGVTPDKGMTGLGPEFIKAACLRHWDREPTVRQLA